MKILHDNDRRRKESFQREHAALIDLSEHPHIVALYDAGMDDAGPFMVLEWVPDNLVSLIAKTGPLPWERFYLEIGRPILGALAFAQSRGWNHRDIKPQNILVTEQTTVKIADYGIARQFERPAIGLTLREYRSEPFTPPESDAGPWSCSQDCFSWAAVAVFCLTATYPTSYERLFGLATGLDSVTVPREILLNSLASIPAERPPLASALLSDLDEYLERQNAQRQPRPRVHVQFSSSSIPQLLSTFDSTDQATAEEMVLQELNEIEVGFRRVDMGDSVPSLRIWAVSWVFEVSRSVQRDRLIITRARPSRASEAERHREEAYRVPVRFTFTAPHSTGSSDVLDELFLNVDAFEIARARRDAQIKRERIFRVWYAFLRAKADYEARRERAVAYTDHEVHDNSIVLTTELPAPVEMVGEARVIRMTSGGHVFCDVVDVNLDEVTVVVTSGDSSKVPRRGLLELNTLAAERAIERQRRALDAVNYERSPNPRLKNLILEPADNRPPTQVTHPTIEGGNFDGEKVDLLKRALGLQDILAIQGPPGTGKTRLIEEILVQYLAAHPGHRILLSAQTQVALDNVIERVAAREPSLDIVRIGRIDEPKISPASRALVLDRKAIAWSAEVGRRAQAFVTKWATDRGIDRVSIEIGMFAERLILLIQQEKAIRQALGKV